MVIQISFLNKKPAKVGLKFNLSKVARSGFDRVSISCRSDFERVSKSCEVEFIMGLRLGQDFNAM